MDGRSLHFHWLSQVNTLGESSRKFRHVFHRFQCKPFVTTMAATRCFDADDERFMRAALVEAEGALRRWEVPVGCVVVRDGEIIAVGSNRTNEKRNGTRHAEFEAIDSILALPDVNHDANKAHFNRCDLYVTCEPCIMCAGALSLLGFRQVVFGCGNDKFGGNGSILSVHESGCFPCGEGGRDIDGDGNTGSIVREGSNPESTSNGTHGTDNCSYKYPSYGGLFANQAVKLLQDFYIRGNPKAPKPHRALAPEAAALRNDEEGS